jgi:ribosomal protein S18 acetylase RimI-like enzyme
MKELSYASPPALGRFERRVWSGAEITPELLAATLEILRAAFPRWPPFEVPVPPIDHLTWKLEHPGWAASSVVGEMLDDVMTGVTLRLHRMFRIGGTSLQARDWVDHCLHPDHQASGIYRRLAGTWKEQRSEYDLGVWSTSHPKVVHATRRSEPKYLEIGAGIRSWLLPLASAAVLIDRGAEDLPVWRRALLSQAAVTVSRLRLALAPTRRARRQPALCSVDRFDQRFSPLVDAAASELDFVQERTPEFLNWRYRDPRGGRFTVRAAEEAGEVVGFAALKTAGGIGYLSDLVTLPGREGIAEALVDAAVDDLRASGVDAVVCRVPARHPLGLLLARGGFVDARLPTGYAISSGRRSLAELRFLGEPGARIHFMLGDVDWA